MLASVRRVTLALLGAAMFVACSDGDSPIEPAPLGTILLSVTPSSVTVAQGASGSAGVFVTRGGNFSGPITLTASGQPGGVLVSFGSSTVASGTSQTSVTVSVPVGTLAGTYSITVRAAGVGAVTQEVILTLRTT